MATKSRTRQTAEERREAIADIAFAEFAARGFHGTPTSDIAKKAGISHAYLFRLFPTKTDLFIKASERCFERTRETFAKAAEGTEPGEERLQAMGEAYINLLDDRTVLLGQMHSYTACEIPEIREAVRRRFGELYQFVERLSGAPPERVREFIAMGMLLNVVAAMGLPELKEPWVERVVPPKMAAKG
jgi:AcrR family transcriptional regulator